MPNVELWFPVAIYKEENLISEEENAELVKYSLSLRDKIPSGGEDWYGDTYNTHGTYDLRNDIKFRPLLNLISMHVNSFAKMHNSNGIYEISYAWLNINATNTYQELHTHNAAIFSCSYYLSAPVGSGGIVFEDPKEPDMFPLENVKYNELSFQQCEYPPIERRLIIFRAYLSHMVKPGNNISPRITAAFNLS